MTDWLTKNIWERKHTRRELIEGAVIERVWSDADLAFAIAIVHKYRDTHPELLAVWEEVPQ